MEGAVFVFPCTNGVEEVTLTGRVRICNHWEGYTKRRVWRAPRILLFLLSHSDYGIRQYKNSEERIAKQTT